MENNLEIKKGNDMFNLFLFKQKVCLHIFNRNMKVIMNELICQVLKEFLQQRIHIMKMFEKNLFKDERQQDYNKVMSDVLFCFIFMTL